jgi:cyclase
VIPTLLIDDGSLVKGRGFKNHKYIGDPINTVRIYNKKEVDELIIFDISASRKKGPDFGLLSEIASEAFMPFGYGGGIKNIQQMERVFSLGVEKVVVNSEVFYNPKLISDAVAQFGSQSIIVSMDVKKTLLGGYEVFVKNATQRTKIRAIDYAKKMQELGVGELIVCSVNKEGSASGYDIKLLEEISASIDVPVVALGGAGKLEDFVEVVNNTHVAAVAAGDMFIFYGKHKAVLITYPEYDVLNTLFKGEEG